MLSPCPKCGIELFYRRLPRKSVRYSAGCVRKTFCCPSCDLPLQTNPTAQSIKLIAVLVVLSTATYGAELLSPLLGNGEATLARIALFAVSCGLVLYAIIAFPFVAQEAGTIAPSE